MVVTLRQLAQEAGVSRATASRVLSGRGAELFTPATRRRVEEAAKRLGYRPNYAARALATGTTHLITLWTYCPYEAFFATVIKEVQQLALEDGYGVLVADVMVAAKMPAANRSPWPSDGILAMDCGQAVQDTVQLYSSSGIPIVSMGSALLPDTDAVELNLVQGFREATEHLIKQGCKRIAYFSYSPQEGEVPAMSSFVAPRETYCSAVQAAGMKEELISLNVPTRAAARKVITEYVGRHGHPDAILCRNDELAVGTYRAMCDLGLEVGKDVLLVGCDGIEDTQFVHCPLSTIVLPVRKMCELAWRAMRRRLAEPESAPERVVLDTTLEIRSSSQRRKKV